MTTTDAGQKVCVSTNSADAFVKRLLGLQERLSWTERGIAGERERVDELRAKLADEKDRSTMLEQQVRDLQDQCARMSVRNSEAANAIVAEREAHAKRLVEERNAHSDTLKEMLAARQAVAELRARAAQADQLEKNLTDTQESSTKLLERARRAERIGDIWLQSAKYACHPATLEVLWQTVSERVRADARGVSP